MPRVVVLPAADRDLDEQALYYLEHGSPETATRWYDQAAATFAFLAEHPAIGAPRESPRRALQGIRTWLVSGFERHVVFYRPIDDGIEVVRVLHGARDLDALLDDR